MLNLLTSGNIQQKIQWYVRAHGHSSIGGLNLLWTYLEYAPFPSETLTKLIEEAIHAFEQFGDTTDVHGNFDKLTLLLQEITKKIEVLPVETDKKQEFYRILHGVNGNLTRVQEIIENPGYEEFFLLSTILHRTITELLHRYPSVLFGEGIDPANAGDRIRLEVRRTGNERQLRVCGYEIQLLLENLLSNAIEAIEVAGEQGTITLHFTYRDDQVELRIEDTGGGLSSDAVNHIRSRIPFTTKEGNHGKGMKIIYDLIDKYQGTLKVESSTNRTVFTITLPYEKDTLLLSLR
jgi:signal transduction histidine kinase